MNEFIEDQRALWIEKMTRAKSWDQEHAKGIKTSLGVLAMTK